jgi:aspartate/methionine/tyrosine aminotransferase
MAFSSNKATGLHFARRTAWDMNENDLTRACRELKASGREVLDLTKSNPTKCGFDYSPLAVESSFGAKENLDYTPDPWGLRSAREAVAAFYAVRGTPVSPENILLTSSTSEGYNYLFRLLCDPGDEILAPAPSYPLFQFLADVNDAKISPYKLTYADGWKIDRESLVKAAKKNTRAIVLVNPNNPTGSYIREDDYAFIRDFAEANGIALICDEVFADYALDLLPDAKRTLIGEDGPATFVLSGLSKILALPQMKLSWIVLQGGGNAAAEIRGRLEMIADTFLSVNAPVENAAPLWLPKCDSVQTPIKARLAANLALLKETAAATPGLSALRAEGGWYGILAMDGIVDEDAFAVNLAKDRGVIVHPGFYYDFDEGEHAVFSLLTEPDIWARALKTFAQYYTDCRM